VGVGLGVCQSKPYLQITRPAENSERWIFDNHEVILTFIHWLGPPLCLLRGFEGTLVTWSERLAKGQYKEKAPPVVRSVPEFKTL